MANISTKSTSTILVMAAIAFGTEGIRPRTIIPRSSNGSFGSKAAVRHHGTRLDQPEACRTAGCELWAYFAAMQAS